MFFLTFRIINIRVLNVYDIEQCPKNVQDNEQKNVNVQDTER